MRWTASKDLLKYYEKLKIKSIELTPFVAHRIRDGRIWDLVSEIIIEKWSFKDKVLESGDVSKILLKRISKILAGITIDKIKKETKNKVSDKVILYDKVMYR